MTAHAMLGDRERFLGAGMSDYVAKPIEEFELFRALSRWLEAEPSAPLEGEAATPPAPTLPSSADDSIEAERPTEVPDPVVLDARAGLRRAGGNQALYDRLLRAFAAEAPQVVSAIDRAASEGDEDGVRRSLHALKGNAATVSALELASLAGALERSPDPGGAPGLSRLEAAVTRLIAVVPPEPSRETGSDRPPTALTDEARAEIRNQLRQLAALVASGNLGARRSLAGVQEKCGASFKVDLDRIEAALFKLDFQAAAREIEALDEGLGRPGGRS